MRKRTWVEVASKFQKNVLGETMEILVCVMAMVHGILAVYPSALDRAAKFLIPVPDLRTRNATLFNVMA